MWKNNMKIDKKNMTIGILSVIVIVTLCLAAYSVVNMQSYIESEQQEEERVNVYNTGYQAGVSSAIDGLLNQIKMYGYVTLTIPVGNSTQMIYLRVFDPTE